MPKSTEIKANYCLSWYSDPAKWLKHLVLLDKKSSKTFRKWGTNYRPVSVSVLSYLLKNTNTSYLKHPVTSNINAGPKEIRVKRFLLYILPEEIHGAMASMCDFLSRWLSQRQLPKQALVRIALCLAMTLSVSPSGSTSVQTPLPLDRLEPL